MRMPKGTPDVASGQTLHAAGEEIGVTTWEIEAS